VKLAALFLMLLAAADLSSPKSAAKSLFAAINAGDRAAVRAASVRHALQGLLERIEQLDSRPTGR
jgi:hypothetical protein